MIGSDPTRDVALVRSNAPIIGYDFHFSAGPLALGQDVAAIGFPFGLPLTVTRGSVSGLDRTVPIDGTERTELIQTDAPVNPGNSGGPLMNDAGGVVGLVDLGTDQANGLAFAVSATTAGPLVQGWEAAPEPAAPASCAGSAAATTVPAAATTMPSPATTAANQTYQGADFSIDYPAGWVVSHLHEGGGNLDTTFEPPGGGEIVLRVDEDPGVGSISVAAAAAPVIAALQKDPTYSLVSLSDGSFDEVPSLQWEFEDTVGGVRVHVLDVFFVDTYGDGWGVLVKTPQALWAQDSGPLESYLETFSE